ncbi:hypothetical protein AAC387_Pa02g2895 [Persea americana]
MELSLPNQKHSSSFNYKTKQQISHLISGGRKKERKKEEARTCKSGMSTSSNGGRRRSPEAEEREKRYFRPVRGPKEEEPSGGSPERFRPASWNRAGEIFLGAD